MDPIVIVLLIVLGLVLIWLAISLFGAALAGAIILFGVAAQQGFIGFAAYVAMWVFLFPAMLVICIVVGILAASTEKRS